MAAARFNSLELAQFEAICQPMQAAGSLGNVTRSGTLAPYSQFIIINAPIAGAKIVFVGHYGVSFGAKPIEKRVPLWVWFIAVQWLDVVWSVLVLLGVEKLRIVPGFTQANALDLYYMPYTHGLPGSIVLSLVFGAGVALFTPGNRTATTMLVAAAAFSHWILDLVVHVPDLPLYDNTAKVGFGLWRYVFLSFPLELIVLGFGAWLYARTVTLKRPWVYWGFVIFLAAMQVYANFGPPPTSQAGMAVMALAFYAVLALAAAAVERFAVASASGT